jgi:hypothetical protein
MFGTGQQAAQRQFSGQRIPGNAPAPVFFELFRESASRYNRNCCLKACGKWGASAKYVVQWKTHTKSPKRSHLISGGRNMRLSAPTIFERTRTSPRRTGTHSPAISVQIFRSYSREGDREDTHWRSTASINGRHDLVTREDLAAHERARVDSQRRLSRAEQLSSRRKIHRRSRGAVGSRSYASKRGAHRSDRGNGLRAPHARLSKGYGECASKNPKG